MVVTPVVIGSCSTLPTRLDKLREAVISVLAERRIQSVIIQYPHFCKRLNIAYPSPPPEWMLQYGSRLIIHEAEDLGPMTKFASLLDMYPQDAKVSFLLFDDDHVYPPGWFDIMFDMVESEEEHLTSLASGFHGSLQKVIPFQYSAFNTGKKPVSVSNLSTAWGSMYPRHSLPKSSKEAYDFALRYKDLLFNDDMMLGSFCFQTKTPLKLLPMSENRIEQWNQQNNMQGDGECLAVLPEAQKCRQTRLACQMMQDGVYPVPWPEITLITFILGIVVFLFILFLIILAKV